ncbi:MAG: M23 family metallopeptidase [Oscillatoriophycideae cyanobacterium NC_groundwater_1537_Pr4_S-0.65um_50_18]|nr:M23 family metallopeptidase [Oscillatoriophycideae cyanobacterium NC_groundwater_1537_Pr4_S-0.65um_50_18]
MQPEQSALKVQVRSVQTQSIQTPSIQAPSVQTRQSASLPNFEANLPRLETRQSSLPQLIKLSRGASKIGANPHLNKSVKQTVNPAISPDASQTSGYWRTIAANCGGLESDRVTVDASSRMVSSGMIFPLPIPVPLTSGFGWRIHPIRGDQRFHSGIDLGAPFGTPVLSALSGRVVAAEDMGGYGLAVIVEASSMRQQNLYAHLSAIAVKPGDWVEQGSVLGLVGSTGSSTGPHLHFETLLPSTEGWTAVDPLGAAMAESVAQVP